MLETRFNGDLRAEQFFCRFYLCADELLQTRAYEKLAQGDQDGAAKLFEQALDRDSENPYRWCDLGDALVETGKTDRARACFRRALEQGPNIPAVLMRAANFYLRIEDAASALPYTSRVLKMVPDYDQVVFSSYGRMNMPVSGVLATGIPENKRAAQSYFRYLLATAAAVDDAQRGWKWLQTRGYTDDPLAAGYLDFLTRNHKYATASAVWAKHLGKRGGDFLEPNRLFNGGFEYEPTGAVFDWKISPIEGAGITRDASAQHSGKFCLRIQFEGQSNLEFSHVIQTAQVVPGTYRFEAFARTEEISTDKGVGFRIFDAEAPGRLDIRTEPLLGTQTWTRIQQVINVPPQTNLVNVQIVRPASMKFDNKIKGTVWFDSVSLRPLR